MLLSPTLTYAKRGSVASRAIDFDGEAHSPVSRLDGWRSVLGDALMAQWDELAGEAAEPNVFGESWFLGPALNQFDPDDRVQLFTVRDAGQLTGLMPIAPQTQYGRWPVPHVQNWLHHNAFLGTPLVRKGHEHAFWQALLHMLDAQPGQALFAHFNRLATRGPLVAALDAVCHAQNRRFALVHHEERALLEAGKTPQAHFESAVRAKKRKELRRQKNRLGEEGELSFARHIDGHGIARWADEFLTLEAAGWKGHNRSALACSAQTRALFHAVLNGAAARGRLERLELRLNGKPLSMLVNFLCAPGSFGFKTAFDEDYARFSPGVLLQIENLALLNRPDVHWCDSCAAEGHPMIDSLWTGRRSIGRYSVAIGGPGRRAIFNALLSAELARVSSKRTLAVPHGDAP
jgi:CelD/BcsL family acetyltransferase involved in cellulose biosynthesis